MLVSLQLLPEQPAAELLDAIAVADELGYYGCYSADEIYHKDMWSIFAAAAGRTERIVLAPGVTHVILRDPTLVAQHALTLDELTGGRTEIAFSVGNIAMLEQYGIEWRPRMLARLREAHHVLRRFLDAGEIDFQGDFYSYSGVFTAARSAQDRIRAARRHGRPEVVRARGRDLGRPAHGVRLLAGGCGLCRRARTGGRAAGRPERE
jgi:5,10-methylenetetrahydromethanopterin reductase